jgi:hypothetical protein
VSSLKVSKKQYFLISVLVGLLLVLVYFPVTSSQNDSKTYKNIVKQFNKVRARFEPKACYDFFDHARFMNDRAVDYIDESFLNGAGGYMRSGRDIVRYVNKGKLVKVEGNEYFVVDTMNFSFPFLTPKARLFVDELGFRFHRKLENTDLQCVKFRLTSILRTTKTIKRLKKKNRNAITKSAHLHGTCFDVSYKSFLGLHSLTAIENLYLKDILAETLFELRAAGKCKVTYEVWQNCFHVVVR